MTARVISRALEMLSSSTPVAPDTPFSYRDANDPDNPFGGSAESLFGSDLGGVNPAPVLVRFQGARLDGSLEDLCDLGDLCDLRGGERSPGLGDAST